MEPRPARVTITRRHPEDVRQRQIVTSVDGDPLGTLLYGESVTREVAPGRHRLKAHNTLFWKNHEVDLAPGEHAHFTVVNRNGFGSFSLLGLFGVGPLYISFDRDQVPLSHSSPPGEA